MTLQISVTVLPGKLSEKPLKTIYYYYHSPLYLHFFSPVYQMVQLIMSAVNNVDARLELGMGNVGRYQKYLCKV